MRAIGAVGLTLLLFILVYAPASALAVGLHLPLAAAVPFVMLVTFLVAGTLVYFLARRTPGGLPQFGIRWPEPRHIGLAVVVGAPFAIGSALLLSHVHEPGPLAGLSLAPWLAVVYFVFGAAIQEEVIFRGLLQTTLCTRAAPAPVQSPASSIAASIAVAVLFGCIHLAVGRYTAVAALVLGAIAGELRRQSGSLVPAIICHSLFNVAGFIWP